jgi:hypothetical protein
MNATERRYLEEEARTGDFFTRKAARELLAEGASSPAPILSPRAGAARGASGASLTGLTRRDPRLGRIRSSVCILSALICSVVSFQAGSAAWAVGASRAIAGLARGLGLWSPRAYARPAAHALGVGGDAGAGRAGPPPRAPRAAAGAGADGGGGGGGTGSASAAIGADGAPLPPPFLAAALPQGADAPGDEPGSHAWLTHQHCWAGADEAEGCVFDGPFCTDGEVVYVSAREGQAAWPPAGVAPGDAAASAKWPPEHNQFSHTGCWDIRTLEATGGCG